MGFGSNVCLGPFHIQAQFVNWWNRREFATCVSRGGRESARFAEGMQVVFCFTQKMARTCIGVVSVAENDEITETQ